MTDDIVKRLREAMKTKARELPYMSSDVEFFGVTDDEWEELLGVVVAPLRAELAAERERKDAAVREGIRLCSKIRKGRDKLREIVEPLVETLEWADRNELDDTSLVEVPLGDLRRARAVLEETE
jgi:hypothetical protein